jgi:hypothetical protein
MAPILQFSSSFSFKILIFINFTLHTELLYNNNYMQMKLFGQIYGIMFMYFKCFIFGVYVALRWLMILNFAYIGHFID